MPEPIGITPPPYPNLGVDGMLLQDYSDTLLYAVSILRSGSLKLDGSRDPGTMSALHTCLVHLSEKLHPRLQGVIDALLVAHRAAGGTWNELSDRASEPLGTLRSRVKRIETDGSHWATWAKGELNPHLTYEPVDLPQGSREGAGFFGDLERQYAEDAAAERAGRGVRLQNDGATFDLGERGVAFLDRLQPLPPAKGHPAVGQLTLTPDQEVSVYPGAEEGWWWLRMFLRGQDAPLVFVITRSAAADLLAAATADAPNPE